MELCNCENMKLWKYGTEGWLRLRRRIALAVGVIAYFHISTIAYSATPSFSAPYDFGIGKRIESLVAVAGPDWREVAARNRTTGLEKLSWKPLESALVERMQKFADKETGDVGGEPLDEMPEIAEASFRGNGTFPYGVALWRHFFAKGKPVRDKVTAAKLLAGFERVFPGIVPLDTKGEAVEFSPGWMVTHVQSGTYKTSLPGGGYFKSSWSNNSQRLVHEVKTSAKRLECHVRPGIFMAFRGVKVNGREVKFEPSQRGCDFTAEPDENGVVRIELLHSTSWAGWWLGDKLGACAGIGACAREGIVKCERI